MTNEEKYKTPSERRTAFKAFCKCCKVCADRHIKPHDLPNIDNCVFDWLALEAEEEKPLPCPCCGAEAKIICGTDWAQVVCQSCELTTEMESTKAEAMAVWNRRVK